MVHRRYRFHNRSS